MLADVRSSHSFAVRMPSGITGQPVLIVGLMSGTSADGIDAAVTEIWEGKVHLRAKLRGHAYLKYKPVLRQRILETCLQGTVSEVCELNFVLGRHLARAALRVIAQAGLKPREIHAISSHGQTVHHLPWGKPPATLQIGEPAVIAEETGILTVADFRVRDVAAGGQGAPLVSYADWSLFTDRKRPRVIQNLGGIGNLTFLPPSARIGEVLAFDTGPANMVIDAVVSELTSGKSQYDRNGILAARGKVSNSLLSKMMAHPFLGRRPPKTTGREEFGSAFVEPMINEVTRMGLNTEDAVATVTAFTAETIADACRRFVFPRLRGSVSTEVQFILGGGGAKNHTLARMIRERVGRGEWLSHGDFGIPESAKEAMAFAILGYETLRGKNSNVPSATGARHGAILGKIILP